MAFLEVNGCRLYSTAGGHVQRDEVEKSSLGKYSSESHFFSNLLSGEIKNQN